MNMIIWLGNCAQEPFFFYPAEKSEAKGSHSFKELDKYFRREVLGWQAFSRPGV
jgi:hypothetical protein